MMRPPDPNTPRIPINYPYPQQLPALTALLHDLQDAVRDENVDRAANKIIAMEGQLKSLEELLVGRAIDKDLLERRTREQERQTRERILDAAYVSNTPLIHEADPELERLLAEEEEIERRLREEFED